MEKVVFPVVEEQPVMWGYHRDLHDADRYKAIVDRDTGKLFSIVSKDYRVIRHEQAIDELEGVIDQTPDLGTPIVKTSFYNDGARMQRTYRFEKITVEIRPGDRVHLQLLLYNSYDLTWPLIVILGAFRFVCANGLVVGKEFFQFRKRHVVEIDRMDFKDQVATALKRFEDQTRSWRKWATRPLSFEIYQKVMKAMEFGKRATETIEEKVNNDVEGFLHEGSPQPTVWMFYNLITWYITHRAVSLNHRVELEKRLRRAVGFFQAQGNDRVGTVPSLWHLNKSHGQETVNN
ncbi:MAG: DUF932 domain-containing protein [Deltaproteobacteria bacterium]|nr:DUF932 domain-containing protein [Deltaproteobacteria bacterium]